MLDCLLTSLPVTSDPRDKDKEEEEDRRQLWSRAVRLYLDNNLCGVVGIQTRYLGRRCLILSYLREVMLNTILTEGGDA